MGEATQVEDPQRKGAAKAPAQEAMPGLWAEVQRAKASAGSGEYVVLYAKGSDIGVAVQKKNGLYDADGSKVAKWDAKMGIDKDKMIAINDGKFDISKAKEKDWVPPLGYEGSYKGKSFTPLWEVPAAKEERKGLFQTISASLGRPCNEFMAPDTTKYGGALGAKLLDQYEKGVDAGVLDPDSGFYLYRMWSGNKVTETGLAYKNDAGTYVRVMDREKVKGGADVLFVKPRSQILTTLETGRLEPKAGKGEDGWDIIGSGQIQMPATTGKQVMLARMTHYMVADASPNTQKGKDAIILQGTGVDSAGNYWRAVKTKSGWTVGSTDGVHGAYKDGALTSFREWSAAMGKWEKGAMDAKALEKIDPLSLAGGSDKANYFYVFVTSAGFVVARQDDTGGAFPSGTAKRDWFMGPEKQAGADWQRLVDSGVFKISGSNFELNGQAYEFRPGDFAGVASLVIALEKQGVQAVR